MAGMGNQIKKMMNKSAVGVSKMIRATSSNTEEAMASSDVSVRPGLDHAHVPAGLNRMTVAGTVFAQAAASGFLSKAFSRSEVNSTAPSGANKDRNHSASVIPESIQGRVGSSHGMMGIF